MLLGEDTDTAKHDALVFHWNRKSLLPSPRMGSPGGFPRSRCNIGEVLVPTLINRRRERVAVAISFRFIFSSFLRQFDVQTDEVERIGIHVPCASFHERCVVK